MGGEVEGQRRQQEMCGCDYAKKMLGDGSKGARGHSLRQMRASAVGEGRVKK